MEKLKVLLVDDEPDLVEVVKMRIISWGYDLIEAFSGKEAIEAVNRKEPDIIVLDYMMPRMDGIQALKKIRKINNSIPVIMFTAHPDEKSIEGAEELNVITFVPKISVHLDSQQALKSALNMAAREVKK